jgi:hypothetical protein
MLMEEIYEYLTVLGLVNYQTGWPCYIGYMPDDQDQTVSLYETGGYPAMELLRENQRVTFQLRVRGGRRDYVNVRNQWLALFNALQDTSQDEVPPFLPGVVYIQALHNGPLMFSDDKGRVNATANFRVMLIGSTVSTIKAKPVPPIPALRSR